MRADRLLSIMGLLQTHGKLSSSQLAEKLEVSERTIHRDMEALSAAGIPVYAERGSQGGWTLPEGYRSRLTGMTAEEISALLLLQTSGIVQDLGLQSSASSALGKLRSALSPSLRQDADFTRQRIHVDGAGWREPTEETSIHDSSPASMLAIVQEAVWAQRKLRIVYARASSNANSLASDGEARLIRPLGLIAKLRTWYVMAQTDPEGELRTYRVSRIMEASVTDEPFARPEGFDLAANWAASMRSFKTNLPRYEAAVRIAADRWDAFRRERFVSIHELRKSGAAWVEANVTFDTLQSACGILLAYGRGAEALSPAELREAVIAEARAVLSLYSD